MLGKLNWSPVFLTLAILLGVAGVSWGAENLVFRSIEDKFRFLYPDTWIVKKPTGANTKAKVAAEDGSNCNVVVRPLPKELEQIPNDQLISVFSEIDMLEQLRGKWADAVLLKGGETYLDNRFAVYGYFDMTHKAFGASVKVRQLSAMTTKFGRAYFITCAAEVGLFSEHRAAFENVMRFFTFEY